VPNKEDIADTLESIGLLLELKGENAFKTRAYANAARAVETYAGSIERMAQEGRLTEIPGIGAAIAAKISELALTGRLAFYEKLRAEFPATLFDLFELQGVGAKKIKALYEQLGVTSVPELEAACKDGRVAGLAGFGDKTALKMLAAIEARGRYAEAHRLGTVAPLAENLLEHLRAHPEVSQACIAGSYRRRKETLHDLDFIVATRQAAEVAAWFTGHDAVEEVTAQGPTKSSVRLKTGVQADLRVVTNGQYPFALAYFTGSKEHNVKIRGLALARGWTLNEYRLAPAEGKTAPAAIPEIHEEADLHEALGLQYIEPELRENMGEIEAAAARALPPLVTLENLRGTFHNHTTASDGRNSLEEMAGAARDLGLEYLGIADHSKSSFQAHGLDAKRLLEQREAIRKLNAGYDGFRLFAGTECDVLRDGTLDFPDEVLSQLDYVVASIHNVFNLPEAEMTARIIRAISNPHVTMLGHLTGRLLLSREGYAVDVPAVIDAAAVTGTWIELNANPSRLDMDWRWWPLAKEKGVRCVINPDAHSTAGLQQLWFGVAAARKGWLTREDVVNCLPLAKIETALAAKLSHASHSSHHSHPPNPEPPKQ
jgi:DNA polymerase (family 10)